jgi:hypothetical protein
MTPGQTTGTVVGAIAGTAAFVAGGIWWWKRRPKACSGTITSAEAYPPSLIPGSEFDNRDVELGDVCHEASTTHPEFPPGPAFPGRLYLKR